MTEVLRPSLADLILLRAVQRLEQTAPLDDVAAMRQAHAAAQTPAARVLARARVLAHEHGLEAALAQWRGRLPWVALAAAALVGLLSYGLVNAVVGHDRQINAVAALLAVLGPHLLSLMLWLLTLIFGGGGGGMAGLAARLLGRSGGGPNRLVLDATLDVLARKPGLSVWAFGLLNHAIWCLALLLTLAGLVFAFSFLAYRLSWESTILGADFFAAVARLSGWLPAQLGFGTPDVARQLGGAGDNKGWALWLLGCTLVYGLGLRLVLLALSALRVRALLQGLTLDSSDPELRALMARFAALDARTELLDLEHANSSEPVPPPGSGLATRRLAGLAVVGYELPEALAWPAKLPAPLARIAGTAQEKRQLLSSLQAAAPARLLLVCHAPSSPDRGSERFIRAALQCAGEGALLLIRHSPAGVPTGMASDAAALRRWRDWVAQAALPLQAIFDASEAALSWIHHEPR